MITADDAEEMGRYYARHPGTVGARDRLRAAARLPLPLWAAFMRGARSELLEKPTFSVEGLGAPPKELEEGFAALAEQIRKNAAEGKTTRLVRDGHVVALVRPDGEWEYTSQHGEKK